MDTLFKKMSIYILSVTCLMACILSVQCSLGAETVSQESQCVSCGLGHSDDSGRMDTDFLEAVKRHILNRLQMRERPNITHPIPKAAMVTALRKLHAGKVREDGRVEIPNLDGHAAYNEVQEETSEIISFAESGVYKNWHVAWLLLPYRSVDIVYYISYKKKYLSIFCILEYLKV